MSPVLPVILGSVVACQLPGEPVRPPEIPILETDLRWFPPREVAEVNYKLAQEHVDWLKLMVKANPTEDYGPWLKDAEQCRVCWEDLYDCHRYYATVWRLEFLRMRLGQESYWAGRMPPPVPLWRFRRID